MIETLKFTLNDHPVTASIDPERTLLWVLRDDFDLTGVKFGCGEGLCGSCTVLVDNKAVRSCQVTVGSVAGAHVFTIEGLAKNGKLHPLQQAFVQHDALQCGFCTPGMILQAYSVLLENPMPNRDQIIDAMDENLCRCGAHVRIIQAIQSAAEAMKGGGPW